MYQDLITGQEEAITHLFFHCCLKDGEYTTAELNKLSDKIVSAGLNKELNFKDEMQKYKSYYKSIEDDEAYLEYLVQVISPVNELALYSYCIELCLSDAVFAAQEESLLKRLAHVLQIEDEECNAVLKLMTQRNVVETQKLF
jgi:uncharacterized tellurite resistance protein B-like protein